MFSHVTFAHLTRLLVATALSSTLYLYLYPIWLGCTFPSTDRREGTAFLDTVSQHRGHNLSHLSHSSLAPFRLLILADPQLEGSTSLPKPEEEFLARLSFHWESLMGENATDLPRNLTTVVRDIVALDVPRELNAWRKRLDLLGNDFYLAHIYRTLHWWTKPSHVTVLGDLIGSQWVDDAEYEYRGWRFWNRVFAGGHRVEDEITESHQDDQPVMQDMDDPKWKNRIINIAGNHDIGYAGDITHGRMTRFEKIFGKANWDVRFKYPGTDGSDGQPTVQLVVFNSMLLDTPAMEPELQAQTYDYLNSIIGKRARPVEDRNSFVLFLTHVPQHKEEGICVDGPMFIFHDEEQDCMGHCKPGSLKEQNHLSQHATNTGTFESMFGMSGKEGANADGKGRPGLILDGHDHAGCDTWHYIPTDNKTYINDNDEEKTNFQAVKWKQADQVNSHTGIREVTLRSMMGEFGGNAGLLSLWFDFGKNEWQYEIKMCRVGVQHIWWAVHIIDIIALIACYLNLFDWPRDLFDTSMYPKQSDGQTKQTKIE